MFPVGGGRGTTHDEQAGRESFRERKWLHELYRQSLTPLKAEDEEEEDGKKKKTFTRGLLIDIDSKSLLLFASVSILFLSRLFLVTRPLFTMNSRHEICLSYKTDHTLRGYFLLLGRDANGMTHSSMKEWQEILRDTKEEKKNLSFVPLRLFDYVRRNFYTLQRNERKEGIDGDNDISRFFLKTSFRSAGGCWQKCVDVIFGMILFKFFLLSRWMQKMKSPFATFAKKK